MKKLLKRNNYLLLESILEISDDFISILKKMKNPIASDILSMVGVDVQTKINNLSLTSTSSMVGFVDDTKYQKDKNTKPSDVSVGKAIRRLLVDNGIKFTDADLEKFVNEFKGLNLKSNDIQLVSGESIRYWYNEENYAEGGELNKSCMREEDCSYFFGIYVHNPDKIRMAILVNEKGLLLSRALIWKLNNGKYYMDRIYATDKPYEDMFRHWFYETYEDGVIYPSKEVLECDLEQVDFTTYPYMDSFPYIYIDKKKASSKPPSENDGKVLECLETEGGYELYNVVIDMNGDEIPKTDAVESDYHGGWIRKDDAEYCEIRDDYYYKEDLIYSEELNSFIPEWQSINSKKYGILYKPQSVNVILNEEGDSDYYPSDKYREFFNYDGKYYDIEVGEIESSGDLAPYWEMVDTYLCEEEDINYDDELIELLNKKVNRSLKFKHSRESYYRNLWSNRYNGDVLEELKVSEKWTNIYTKWYSDLYRSSEKFQYKQLKLKFKYYKTTPTEKIYELNKHLLEFLPEDKKDENNGKIFTLYLALQDYYDNWNLSYRFIKNYSGIKTDSGKPMVEIDGELRNLLIEFDEIRSELYDDYKLNIILEDDNFKEDDFYNYFKLTNKYE